MYLIKSTNFDQKQEEKNHKKDLFIQKKKNFIQSLKIVL